MSRGPRVSNATQPTGPLVGRTRAHNALYRVTGVDYTYRRRLDYDWLGNQTVWNDDAHAFYERSLGTSDASRRDLLNGTDANESSSGHRPAALYFASNVDHLGGANDPAIDRGGYLEVEYGESGNVLSMTVRAQCHDTTTTTCDDPGGTSESARASSLQTNCVCDAEQHYQYRWDALNRLSFARRYDRGTSHPDWRLEVRQQYRYDGANVRMVKRSRDGFSHGASMNGQDGMERVALYVMPGDFERRGLQTGALSYDASVTLGTETQYLIAGTRLVWKDASVLSGGAVTSFDRDARLTASVPDLLQSSVATLDLMTGELLERGTYLPSGVRETLHSVRDVGSFQLEPVGFTGKEGDDEVGLVYFGHRYLMPHLGRWASPDPLEIHSPGDGGEFGNAYHYVSGNLLQARDPNGLWPVVIRPTYTHYLGIQDARGQETALHTMRLVQEIGLSRVLQWMLSTHDRIGRVLPGNGHYTHEVRELTLERIRGEIDLRDEAMMLSAFGTNIEEYVHAYMRIYEDQEVPTAIRRAGRANYDGARLTTGARASDPERVYQEAVGGYIGHRVGKFAAALDTLGVYSKRGILTQETFDAVRSQYNADMAQRVFGYEDASGSEIYTSMELPSAMREIIDSRVLGGQIPDDFDDVPQFQQFEPAPEPSPE